MKHLVVFLFVFGFFGCQAAYRISPTSLPRSLNESFSLKAPDGTTHNFTNLYRDHVGTVVFFWQAKCPCVKRYQDRIARLAEQYGKDKVAMFFVSSNTNETFQEAITEFEKRALTLPLFRDEGGVLAKAIGAKGTPTAALFNQAGDLVYLGWIDNERFPGESKRIAYLEDAINDLLAQRSVTFASSPMFGCPIH